MKMESYIGRLMDLFPNSYINRLNELILYSSTNLYFDLDDVNSEQDIKFTISKCDERNIRLCNQNN